ncbi:MAG: tRNA pseudouridine(38-40) synthase TruA [Pseudomonadota bacterium]
MTRFKLLIEYEGTPFRGWQRQDNAPTVQGALEAAAEKLNGVPTLVYGAGRTDTGVHARGQVAHLDLRDDLPEHKVADAMNFHLRPDPIGVLRAEAVPDSFHARFSAAARHYRYIIVNRRADLTLEASRAWRVASLLDAEAMQFAAQALVGVHDFTTFRDTQCQSKSPEKSLDHIKVLRDGDTITVDCSAISFLHRQVRSIVGSLVEVGRGQREPGWIDEILKARDRRACGPVAPADGLYLEAVDYPEVKEDAHHGEN